QHRIEGADDRGIALHGLASCPANDAGADRRPRLIVASDRNIARKVRLCSPESVYQRIDIANDFLLKISLRRSRVYSAAMAKAWRVSWIISRISQTHLAHWGAH